MKNVILSVAFIAVIQICFTQTPGEIDSLRNVIKQPVIEDSSRAKALIMLSYDLVFSSPDSSQLLADEAQHMSEKIQWQMGVALSLRQKGLIFYYASDYLQAIEYSQKALKAGETLKSKIFDASVYNNLANIYADMGAPEKALSYYNRLLEAAREIQSKKYEIVALTNIGNIYSDLNDHPKALEYFQKGLLIARQNHDLNNAALILANIGITLKNQGNYNSALSYLEQGIAVSDSSDNKYSKAMTLTAIADVYTQLEEYVKAKIFGDESLQLAKEVGSVSAQADAYKTLSTIYEKQNMGAEALGAYKNYILFRDSILNDEKNREITRKELQYENDKKEALANAEINRQKVIRNASISAGSILLLAAISILFFYKRKKDSETKKKEAELKAEIINTEMKALRAQMNPHFIFNSLNSIADYIDKSEIKAASAFTIKFAKLMRMVLENSEQKEIPLSDDLKALELYIQLERFRLQNKFNYEIKIDANIDKDNTLVPPLILQPFVENSIWHGIAKKEGNGNIVIHIQQEKEMLNCIVEDDGIGISETVNSEKKSVGLRITKDRIDVINKQKNSNASIHVYNKERGVKAEVKLPLELSF